MSGRMSYRVRLARRAEARAAGRENAERITARRLATSPRKAARDRAGSFTPSFTRLRFASALRASSGTTAATSRSRSRDAGAKAKTADRSLVHASPVESRARRIDGRLRDARLATAAGPVDSRTRALRLRHEAAGS